MSETNRAALFGIFVGGRSERMGGSAKGLLRTPDGRETLIERLIRIARDVDVEPVLVGAGELGGVGAELPRVFDREPRVGPLSGLAGLFDYAGERTCVAVACDMPYLSAALITRVLCEAPGAPVLAPRDHETGKWQPLTARYTPVQVAPVLAAALERGARSFQALFRELSVVELPLSSAERAELRDWDTPEDVRDGSV